MLSENKNNGDGFDKFLKDSLKQYSQPVPIDFPQRMLSRLQQLEQQKALKQVVLQERLLMAACILLPIAGGILALMFPNFLMTLSQLPETLYFLAKETAVNMVKQWQLWIIYTVIAAFVLYAAYDVLLTDN